MMYPFQGHWFKRIVRGVGVTGGTVRVADRIVPEGVRDIYTHIVLENETSGGNTVRVGVYTPYNAIVARFFATFAADVPQTYDNWPIHVDAGEYLYADFIGSTNGDELVLSLFGYTVLNPVPQS